MPDNKTFQLIVIVIAATLVLCVAMITGTTMYGISTAKEVELEKAKVTQQEKTERTHTRWDWVPFKRERD